MISGLTNIKYLKEHIPEVKIYWNRNEFKNGTWSIINANANLEETGHWVLIYKNYYIDPFGNPPCDEIVKELLNKYEEVHISTKKIQYKNSSNCGNICIYIANMIKEGHSVDSIIESQR